MNCICKNKSNGFIRPSIFGAVGCVIYMHIRLNWLNRKHVYSHILCSSVMEFNTPRHEHEDSTTSSYYLYLFSWWNSPRFPSFPSSSTYSS
jgi:hypothetical protein